MRRLFSVLLIFFLLFHFLLPSLYFICFDFVNLYSDVQGYAGMVVNVIAILGALVIIQHLPSKEKAVVASYNHLLSFFIISIFIFIYKFISGGGYVGMLTGNTNGTWISFLSLFFNMSTAFLLMMCLQKDIKHIYFLLCLYVILLTYTGSRSAIIIILFLLFYLPLFSNYEKVGRKIKHIFIVLAIVSPLCFKYATSIRSEIDKELLGKIIIGRISLVELSMIPLKSYEDGSMDATVFNEKYSSNSQIRQVLNVILPIDPFPYDVNPNQYFRQIFLGASESSILSSYMSMNMTLPVYFILKTNYVIGIIITILFLSFLFCFWIKFASNKYIFFSILFSLYDILYYFDWVMIVQHIFSICCTLFAVDKYEKIINSLNYTLKKHFINSSKKNVREKII